MLDQRSWDFVLLTGSSKGFDLETIRLTFAVACFDQLCAYTQQID
jgi:hypothetical protein